MDDGNRDHTADRRVAGKKARDERLAAALRANLKRRKASAKLAVGHGHAAVTDKDGKGPSNR